MITWTIQDGIGVARILEPTAIANGYHVALGGGVLINGVSEKDLDLFFYLHTDIKNKGTKATKPEELVLRLSEIGFKSGEELKNCKNSPSDSSYKMIIKTEYLGRRIDCIFLLPNPVKTL